jgi:cell wall-associated NlpC family hydrolase
VKEEPLLPFWRTASAVVVLSTATFATASAAPSAAATQVAHTGAVRLATAQTVAPTHLRLDSPSAGLELGDLLSAKDATSAADMKMWLGEPRKDARAGSIQRFARGIVNRTTSIAASLTRNAMRYIGTPYVFGGTSPSGFDCSGYTQHIFALLGIRLPRTADAQYYSGRKIRGEMSVGDLVFFQTYEPGPSHVGIYLGAGRFIHSSSHGVMISRLGDSYWSSRYLGAKRFVTTL